MTVEGYSKGDSKKCLFICTVGTSILTKIKEQKGEIDIVSQIQLRDKNITDTNRELIKQLQSCKEIENIFNKDEIEKISDICSLNQLKKDLDIEDIETLTDYSAELSTLKNYDPQIFAPEDKTYKVILIPTSTASSLCCAHLIREYLKLKNINCQINCVKYLSFADSPEFADKGLPEFLNQVFQIAKTHIDSGYEVILNPTGGYKSLFPLMTIVGILLKCKVIYKYEESNRVIEIPPIPLSVNIYQWYREFPKIEIYIGKDFQQTVDKIPEDFRPLVENNRGILQTTILYQFFKKHISQLDRRFNPLHVKATHTSLLDYLEQYREKIVSLSEIVHLIWKGDRVPEMVDHGLRHHTNLIMIAERLLLPILDIDRNFLSPEELFILLCAIYFHDCGHVIGSIERDGDRIILFPDEIRDFHHILGFERLRNYNRPTYFSSTIYEHLMKTWQINSPQMIWDSYLKAPAYIGLYHRRAMPLLRNQQSYDKHTYLFGTAPYEPLENQTDLSICDRKISKNRILLLCALFRIIDSLDVQVARTGDELEIKFHEEQLTNEIDEEKTRAEKYIRLIEKQIKQVADEIKELFNGRVPKSQQLRKKLKEIEQKYQLLYLASEEYIRANLRIHFKEKQKSHFEKHKLIEQVIIEFKDYINQKYLFNIDLKFKPGLPTTLIQTHRSNTLSELMDEYCSQNGAVKNILNNNAIEISYGGITC